jgi:hypothetical protein
MLALAAITIIGIVILSMDSNGRHGIERGKRS